MKKIRAGRSVKRTLYLQQGPEPADTDPVVGLVDTTALAAEIVAAVNERRSRADDELARETQENRAQG